MPTPPIRSPFRHLPMVLGPAIAGSDPTLVLPRNGARRVYRRSRTTKGAPDIAIAVPICVMVSMGFAVALVPLRSHVTQTTVALALMVLVVFAASIGGRAAGVSTALATTLSFDFLFTRPFLSLKIGSADDVEITVLLLISGLIVGTLSARADSAVSTTNEARRGLRHIHRLAELVAAGAPPADVIALAEQQLVALLGLHACRFDSSSVVDDVAVLHRSGALDSKMLYQGSGSGFELPRDGVALAVLASGREVGWFVMTPTTGVGTSLDERIVAVAVADQVGAAIALRDAKTYKEDHSHG